jgi:hypothetical protein
MVLIAHRVNTIEELEGLPYEYGVEIDLRDKDSRIILQHDPFKGGQDFEEYLQHYKHDLMILNVKSERIEHKAKDLLCKYRINNYFFLDSSFPMIHLLSSQGEKNIAVRFSEFEKIDTVFALKGKISWVWVDCFTSLPINKQTFLLLKNAGFKLCLVSPELQGREKDLVAYKNYLEKEQISFDAVCTKTLNFKFWENVQYKPSCVQSF